MPSSNYPSPSSTSRPLPARERLLQAAAHLFYAQGVSATGIDAITSAAGVAKKSLYNNFSSKSALIDAYIEARHREWLDLYEKRLPKDASPVEGILAVFDAYIDHAESNDESGFRGCGLLNAAAELPAGSQGRETVRRHKEQVEAIVAGHLQRLGGDDMDATATAVHLSFLLEGAMSRAGLEGTSHRLVQARTIAGRLLGDVRTRART